MSLASPTVSSVDPARIIAQLATELGARPAQVAAAVELLDDGATVPFIARYRKEATGGLDDTVLRELEVRLAYLRELESRRLAILESIEQQGKLTPELKQEIAAADTKQRLEDLYAPYKPKRRTRAQIAREAGLEPLADAILADAACDPAALAAQYLNPEAAIADAKAALDGARDILMERLAEAPSRIDTLFLSLYAALGRLEDALSEPRLYIDGLEAVWTLLRHPAIRAVWGEHYPKSYHADELPGDLKNDLQYLRVSGLLYATTRLERVRNVFVDRPKYGATGWGRRLSSQLHEATGDVGFKARLDAAMDAIFGGSISAYQGYFGLLGEEEPGSAQRRRELRRQMPIAVTR